MFFDFSYSPIRDEDGHVRGILVICLETTSKVSFLARLAESEQRYRTLIKEAPIGIIVLMGQEMQVRIVNDAYGRLIGRNPEDLVGQPLFEIIPETEAYFRPIIEEVRTTRTPFYLNNAPYAVQVGGKEIKGFLNLIYQPYGEELKEDSGVMILCRDVTEQVLARKRLEESEARLEQKNKELLRINNELDNFIYTASHDLKSPMSNIEGLLISLREHLESENFGIGEETGILLELMERSIARFKETITDLTDVAKINKDVEGENISEVDLSELLDDVALSLRDEMESSGAWIIKQFEVTQIRFSKKNLKSILYNLLSNAVKYRRPGEPPLVRFSSQMQDEYTVLTVQDNGLGLSESSVSQMFTMFKRFHNHVEGSGVGLYIVQRIMENAGGRIEVDSELGKGTRFTLYFSSKPSPLI